MTTWRTQLRRSMNERDVVCITVSLVGNRIDNGSITSSQITRGIHTDCLLNYETVKYFGGEQHEGERYREAIRQYQAMEYKVLSTWT